MIRTPQTLAVAGVVCRGASSNDPANNSNDSVRSVYTRENCEKVWQESTGGVAYVYHPRDVPLPANLPGVTPNS